MRKLLLGIVTALALALPTVAISTPAHAGTSKAPTVRTPNVAKGKTIKVRVNKRGSKILRRTSTLWKDGRRVHDWSPKPGSYRVKTVIRYQQKTTKWRDVWVPDRDCADYSEEGYDDNGDGDFDDYYDVEPYDACAPDEIGYWDYRRTVKLSGKKKVTRWTTVKVAHDESPGCVSRSEFRAVKDGMTQAKVHGIFGTTGRVTYRSSGGVGREYDTCTGDPDWSYVQVDYNPRVWFKWQYIAY